MMFDALGSLALGVQSTDDGSASIYPSPVSVIVSVQAPVFYSYITPSPASVIVSITNPEVYIGEVGRVYGPAWQSG